MYICFDIRVVSDCTLCTASLCVQHCAEEDVKHFKDLLGENLSLARDSTREYDLAPFPPPLSPLPSVNSIGHTQED